MLKASAKEKRDMGAKGLPLRKNIDVKGLPLRKKEIWILRGFRSGKKNIDLKGLPLRKKNWITI
jgi:hypothetical protein